MLASSSPRSRKQSKKALPKILPGSVHSTMVRCGKPGCKCESGELHGPYYYHYWREGGRLRKRYIRAADATAAAKSCKAHQAERKRRIRTMALLRQTSMDTWRSAGALIKQIEQLRSDEIIRRFYDE